VYIVEDECNDKEELSTATLDSICACERRYSDGTFRDDYILWRNMEAWLEETYEEGSCELKGWADQVPFYLDYSDEDFGDLDLGGEYGPWDSDYRGEMDFTASGYTCMEWGASDPHENTYLPEDYPWGALEGHNYCRNPDFDELGTWCYTTDPDVRWDYCDLTLTEQPEQDDSEDYYDEDGTYNPDYWDLPYTYYPTYYDDPYTWGWFYNYYWDCNYWYDYYYYCDVGYYNTYYGDYWYDAQLYGDSDSYYDEGSSDDYNAYGADHTDEECNYWYDTAYYCSVGWYDETYGDYWYDEQLYGVDYSYDYYYDYDYYYYSWYSGDDYYDVYYGTYYNGYYGDYYDG